MSARAALLALNRFAYNDFAQQNAFKEEQSSRSVSTKGRGFLVGELNRYPWNVTSNISGNGVQPENFDLYLKSTSRSCCALMSATLKRRIRSGATAAIRYPFPTKYQNNSGYITLPHIYLRARLGMDSPEILTQHLDSARKNLPLVARAARGRRGDQPRNSVYFTDWGRCAFMARP